MSGKWATWSCGITAAPCIAAIPSIPARAGLCTVRRSKANRALRRKPRVRKSDAPRIVLALLCLLYLILFVNRVNISTAAPLMRADLISPGSHRDDQASALRIQVRQ